MTEIDLIVKYLERRGTSVKDFMYYDCGIYCNSDAFVWNLGDLEGLPVEKMYFFGHVSVNSYINGVVVLTNANSLNIQMASVLFGRTEVAYVALNVGVNENMSLLGNGTYKGYKRLYGMGFNQVLINEMGFGAATFEVRMGLNGYVFFMK